MLYLLKICEKDQMSYVKGDKGAFQAVATHLPTSDLDLMSDFLRGRGDCIRDRSD